MQRPRKRGMDCFVIRQLAGPGSKLGEVCVIHQADSLCQLRIFGDDAQAPFLQAYQAATQRLDVDVFQRGTLPKIQGKSESFTCPESVSSRLQSRGLVTQAVKPGQIKEIFWDIQLVAARSTADVYAWGFLTKLSPQQPEAILHLDSGRGWRAIRPHHVNETRHGDRTVGIEGKCCEDFALPGTSDVNVRSATSVDPNWTQDVKAHL